MKTRAERHFEKLATRGGLALNTLELSDGIGNFVQFLRVAANMENNVNNELRNFGADFIGQTRSRIIAAGADYTPQRICRAAANGNIARVCTY